MNTAIRGGLVSILVAALAGCGDERPTSRPAQSLPPDSSLESSWVVQNHESVETSADAEPAVDRILVKFRTGTAERDMEETLRGRAKEVRKYARHNRAGGKKGPEFFDTLAAVTLEEGVSAAEEIGRLRHHPHVEYAESDGRVSVVGTPNDPRYPELWGMAKIQAPAAWDLNTGSPQVVVAVIDTGIEFTHPDLAANLWVNADEIPGNRLDDDANGFADDIYGYDFFNRDSVPMDDNFHGTHVAGTIGAVGNNGVGVAGVSWNVRLMALKFLSSGGSGDVSDAILCIQYAVNNGAHILSNSWGGGGFQQALQDAITAANNAGCLFVAAAGNSNADSAGFSPAGMAGVLTVAATDSSDMKAPFSNYGASVEISAPGVSILSCGLAGSYRTASGTSMACPHVAGLAALIKSRNFALTKDQIQAFLTSGADDLGAAGWDPYFGQGRINAGRTVANVNPAVTSFPIFQIASPASGEAITGAVDVVGTAAGARFSSYRLEVLFSGDSSWTLLRSSTMAVTNSVLGRLDPTGRPDGTLMIRLTVRDSSGYDYSTAVVPRFVTSAIDRPLPYSDSSASAGGIAVTGTAASSDFVSYALEYGAGTSPSSWSLIVRSTVPVVNGLLGTFRPPAGSDGYFTIRLTTTFASSSKGISVPIYYDGRLLPKFPVSSRLTQLGGFDFPLTLIPQGLASSVVASLGPLPGFTYSDLNPYLAVDRILSGGTAAAGWPPSSRSLSTHVSPPAVGDLDGDGVPELVVTGLTNVVAGEPVRFCLYALRLDGSTLFQRPISGFMTGTMDVDDLIIPTLEDVNGDGRLEIVVGGGAGYTLNVFDRYGNYLPGFPVSLPNMGLKANLWPTEVAAGDLDGDGRSEIVFRAVSTADNRDYLYVRRSGGAYGAIASSLPRFAPPVIGDVNGDGRLEIITVAADSTYGWLSALRVDGTPLPGFPVACDNGMSISLGDLDGSGTPEIVLSSGGRLIRVYRGDGSRFPTPDLSFSIRGGRNHEVLIADVDGDGRPDLVSKSILSVTPRPEWNVGGVSFLVERVAAWSADGRMLPGYPKQFSEPDTYSNRHSRGSLTVGDLDADGVLDLVAGSNLTVQSLDGRQLVPARLKAWSLGVPATAKVEWGKHRGDLRNTGRYRLSQSAPPPSDGTPPTCSITSPANGAIVSGAVTIAVTAADNVGVARVEFYRSGTLLGIDATVPYVFLWDTAASPDGSHNLVARAFDGAGNSASSSPVTVTVRNSSADTSGPTLSVVSASGTTVSGKVTISVSAGDPSGVARVEFYVNGALKYTDSTAPWGWSWNSNSSKGQTVTITVRGYDSIGNVSSVSLLLNVR